MTRKVPPGKPEILEQRPIMVALAGPNGAGKSTFYESQLAGLGFSFVNADVLALNAGVEPYAAAQMADMVRRELVSLEESFIFETVFSDPVGDKVEFLRAAQEVGFTVLLIFIGIDSSSLSDDRVAMRVSQGGHDVPPVKIAERFPRVMRNLKRALVELPNVWVYDNSDLNAKYRLVALKEDGRDVELHGRTPQWLRPLLP